jgi:hypothetical protein
VGWEGDNARGSRPHQGNFLPKNTGLFSSFIWEQGFNKIRESSRTLELFERFYVQFWETGPWAPPPTFKSSQLLVYVYI